MNNLKTKIFEIENAHDFENLSISIFKYQAKYNVVYKKYLQYLNIDICQIKKIKDIPFLPIDFFKTHKIITENQIIQTIFLSSGTTLNKRSSHFIVDENIYQKSFLTCFKNFYGNPEEFCFLALLPSYLENGDSSLVYMLNILIQKSKNKESGFYLNNLDELVKNLKKIQKSGKKIFLIGVSFALLDLAEKYDLDLSNIIIMETGGMKGKRKELIRSDLHDFLKKKFHVEKIHSEYGMTELLSQAYSKENGIFKTPNWMKILIRDIYDPFSYLENGKTGGINIIDLANIYTCSFIETKDLGRLNLQGNFEILGRFDNSDIRGCNLLF